VAALPHHVGQAGELRTAEVAEPPTTEPLEAPRASGGHPTFRLDLAGAGSSPGGGHLHGVGVWRQRISLASSSLGGCGNNGREARGGRAPLGRPRAGMSFSADMRRGEERSRSLGTATRGNVLLCRHAARRGEVALPWDGHTRGEARHELRPQHEIPGHELRRARPPLLPCSCGCAGRARPPLRLRRWLHSERQAPSLYLPPSLLRVGTREEVASVGPTPAPGGAPVSLRIRRKQGAGRENGVGYPVPAAGKKRYPSPCADGLRAKPF
jgi:hypothetical protein